VTEGSRPEVNADMPISRQPNRELYLTGGGRLEVKADAYKAALDGLRYGEAKEHLRLAAYKVKPGDTLASVARDQMQDEGRRFELAGLNGLGDDAPLSPGSVLKIILKR